MPSPDTVRAPYPGLRPFEADEADLFFGRERHVDALLKRLSGSHFVAVIGESGAGKSSLVRAGLLPALQAGFVVEAGSDWRVAIMRPGGAPLAALADALLTPGVLSVKGGAPRPEFALAELRRGPLGFVQLVRDAHLGQYCNTLLVVDQFEELFRYGREPAQKDQANIFVELLLQASQQRQAPIFVVLTMRSDFVGDCARFRGLPESLNDNQYLTPRLTRDQIAAAIREPARVCGGTVDQALVDALCNEVGDDQDQLPLLQHLLMRLWDRAAELSNPPCLTSELSREMGGLRCALNNHAQQIYDSLPGDAQRAIAHAMFKSLTDPRSLRRDLRRDALVSEVAAVAAVPVDAAIAVADTFRATGQHMLMPPPTVPLDASSRLDISHESLLRQWSTLSKWAREEGANAREFDRLREEAKREREEQGELLSGRALARAQDWIKQAEPTPAWAERYAPPGELDALLTFISRSEEEAKRKKNEVLLAAERAGAVRRARLYSWVAGGALVLASAVAIVIFNLWQRAESSRAQAEGQRGEAQRLAGLATDNEKRATEFSLAVQTQKELVERQNTDLVREGARVHASLLTENAQSALSKDSSLAVLLARKAVFEGGADSAAIRALRDAVAVHVPNVAARLPAAAAKSKTYIPGTDKGAWLDFSLSPASVSSQDDLVITPSGSGAIIWSAASGKSIKTLGPHKGIVGSASFSPDGRLAITTSADGTGRVWDVATARPLQTLPHTAAVNGAVFNRNGTRLVTLGDDDVAKVWKLGDSEAPLCELKRSGNFIMASFSSDQNLLATVRHHSGTWDAEVWDLTGDKCPRAPVSLPLLSKLNNLKWLSFSDRGSWLGVVTTDGETIVLSVPDSKEQEWKEQGRLIPRLRYEPSESGNRAEDLPPPLAWSHSGDYVAVAGGDNTVYVAETAHLDRRVELRGHTGRVTSIAFSPADDVLLTTSRDSTARLWTFSPDKRVLERLVLSGHKDTVGSGVFSFKGDRVVTTSDDGTARSWTPSFGLRDLSVPSASAQSVQSRGPRRGWGLVKGVWVSGVPAAMLASRGRELESLGVLSGFERPRIVEPATNGITVRDLRESASSQLLPDSDGFEVDQFDGTSPSGRFIFAKYVKSRNIRVWDLKTQARPADVPLPASKKNQSCDAGGISDDGRAAWYCAEEDLVLVVRPGQTPPLAISIAGKSKVESMRFSTQGRLLALTLEDYSVRVVDTSTGYEHPPMRGHDGRISGVDFSPDDRFLVTTSFDATARVWEIERGVQIAVVTTNVAQLTSAAFSSDGLSLLLLSRDRPLLWRCYACGTPERLLAEVQRRKILRPLSPYEEDKYGVKSGELNAAHPEQSQHSHVPHDVR